jgi:RNA polymerase sigma-70 factor (ECF subfamily)
VTSLDEQCAAALARATAAGTDRDEIELAIACARGEPAAIARFERDILDAAIPQALASMRLPAATADDLRSIVRDKLLLPPAPRILDYAGQGRLRGLVAVMATRAALDRIRAEAKEVELPAQLGHVEADTALALIKEQYRAAFSAGFARAVTAIPRRDRNLLRLHFLGGVTLEQLAQMYDVHRATIVRWLSAARERVFADTRAHLVRELRAPADELDAMFALVESRVELSMDRLLATTHHSR